MNARSYRLTWRTAGLMALVLGAWFAPAQARAGCGDGHIPLRTPPRADKSTPARPLPPCTGPTCSRLPFVPPVVPPAAEPPTEDPAALANGTSLAISRPSRRLADEPTRDPVRQADSIFHPPR